MTVRVSRIISGIEFHDREKVGLSLGFYSMDRHVFPAGSAWYQPWYFDPEKREQDALIKRRPIDIDDPNGLLSPHYWSKWAGSRPPICIVCPNGELWEIDRRSRNGQGWVVSGNLDGPRPTITCSPSIVVDGYHGWLNDGVFSEDIEGRGPIGTVRPYTKRVVV